MGADALGFVGYEFKPWRFQVERGKIGEFAQAIGDENPLYLSSEAALAAGLAEVIIPPTFFTVIDMWGGLDFFELVEILHLNASQVLHGEQEYFYFQDVYVGDEIKATAKVSDVKSKAGAKGTMNFFTIETKYTNQHDVLVAVARSVVVELP